MTENLTPSDLVDLEDSRPLENQRLLEPGATPENLRTFAFGLGIPMPTRTMTRETFLALRNLVIPMFGHLVPYSPDGMEVGDARNHIVEQALADGVKHLMFVDYDVAPPANALVKLLGLKVPIAAGVYHLKQIPSYPLIQVKGWPWAYEDYHRGELLKVDGCGMGCTLIDMEVFKKIKPPWFKTSGGYSMNSYRLVPGMTEDIYFCNKAKKAGFDIIVDTEIQCGHVDWRTGVIYMGIPDPNDASKIVPGWIFRDHQGEYISMTTPRSDHPGFAPTAPLEPKTNGKWLDLGSGPTPPPRYTGIDLFHENKRVIKGDIESLAWYRKEHGLVKKIRASHSLEHMNHHAAQGVLRDWVRTLVPGGEIQIRVPDGEKHLRLLLERIDNHEDVDPLSDWLNLTIYGLQIGPGQEHHTLFTERRLTAMAKAAGLVEVKVEHVMNKGDGSITADTWELVLTGKRARR